MRQRKLYVQYIINERKEYLSKMQAINDPENPKYMCYALIEEAIDELLDRIDVDYSIRNEITEEARRRIKRKFKNLD